MERRRGSSVWLAVTAGALVAITVGLVVWSVTRGSDGVSSGSADDPGPVHVHALGIDPADEALFIATHTGLYRVDADAERARRVSDRHQDTMGFTVVGPGRFLGSGHPDVRDGLPSLLGLIESADAGVTWKSVSLLGEADFHVLRRAGPRLYGYDASNDRLLVSADGGEKWDELSKPGAIVDLVVSAVDPRHIVVSTVGGIEEGLFRSSDAGRTWQKLGDRVGLLAWPAESALYVVAGNGDVFVSADGGRRLDRRGELGGEPAALAGRHAQELYVAFHDGTVKRSVDGGATWTVRSTP